MVATFAEKVFVLVFLGVFSIVGAIGNALVIHVYRQKREKLVSSVFILTLAVVDLSTCIMVIPFTMYMEASSYDMPYDIICKLYSFLITCTIPFSAFVMVAIAVDRYFCICHPFLHVLTPLRAKITVLVLGCLSSVFGVITALLYGVYRKADTDTGLTTIDNITINGIIDNITSTPITYVNYTSLTEVMSNNMTSYDFLPNVTTGLGVTNALYTYTGICDVNFILLDMSFIWIYQRVYYTMFVLDLLIVVVLYILIYKSVVQRRTKRQRQKSASLALVSMQDDMTLATEDTLCTIENGVDPDKLNSPTKEAEQPLKAKNKAKRKASKSAKWDRKAMANIRTAAMLFVVTMVFIVMYLPASLMALMVIPYSMTIFYLYFFNFVANPLIYAFMNKTFRDDLKRLLNCS